ncbi:hypothetical protein GEMRC1_002514 [Eukaryota sp. GEM-RC1]
MRMSSPIDVYDSDFDQPSSANVLSPSTLKKKTSAVWKHFTPSNQGKVATCSLCPYVDGKPSNKSRVTTSRLKLHLDNYHNGWLEGNPQRTAPITELLGIKKSTPRSTTDLLTSLS